MQMDGFEEKYKVYYKAVRNVNLDSTSCSSGISLFHDVKACSDCKARRIDICETAEVLKIGHKCVIVKVELEKFFTQFDGTALSSLKCRCDLLLYDRINHRIAFCELSCSKSKYIEPYDTEKGSNKGKRAKAYEQLKSSIEKFADVPDIKSMMDVYPNKTALFAVRRKDRVNSDSLVISNMEKFSALSRGIQDGSTSDMGNGFTFEEIVYPSVYRW